MAAEELAIARTRGLPGIRDGPARPERKFAAHLGSPAKEALKEQLKSEERSTTPMCFINDRKGPGRSGQ